MFLIATDEAGYGPKLGPLVIAATGWRLPIQSPHTREDLFAPLRQPTIVGDVTVVVDDSKSVYQPNKDKPLASLHAAVSVCNHWMKFSDNDFARFLQTVAKEDVDSITGTAWLEHLSGDEFLSGNETVDARSTWSSLGIHCEKMLARIITAKAFNQACEGGLNKADLLSESTLGLVHQLVREQARKSEPIVVYCDRHGGRRYYAGVLQHIFDDATVQVVSESKQQSVYRVESDGYDATIHFTVKGDTFTPVAMSSIYAKYIRERMMQSFNAYFAVRHRDAEPLKADCGIPHRCDAFPSANPADHRS